MRSDVDVLSSTALHFKSRKKSSRYVCAKSAASFPYPFPLPPDEIKSSFHLMSSFHPGAKSKSCWWRKDALDKSMGCVQHAIRFGFQVHTYVALIALHNNMMILYKARAESNEPFTSSPPYRNRLHSSSFFCPNESARLLFNV